jgi:hypothetical protein
LEFTTNWTVRLYLSIFLKAVKPFWIVLGELVVSLKRGGPVGKFRLKLASNMPELPEVETMRRGLFPCIGGRIVSVVKPRSKYRPIVMEPALPTLRKRLLGCRVIGIDRLGKRVVIRLDSTDALVLQPKMAGLVLVGLPPNQAHARLVIEAKKGSGLFSVGIIHCRDTKTGAR